jgi:glycine/D-amino acid oxidase-like deaminating enzyme
MSTTLADAHVIVVGAGAVGSCTGYRLAQAGAAVTIVDRGYPGGATSGNSFAWLNAFGKFPRHYYRLSIQSIQAHRELEWELEGNWLTLNGGLHWESPSGHSPFADLKDSIRRLHGWGARIDTFSPEEVMRSVEPGLRVGKEDADAVYLVRDEGWVQPALMIRAALHRAVAEYGANIVTASVVDLVSSSEGVGVVLDSGQRIRADVVVVAAGADSPRIAALAGRTLPVETNCGILAVTAPAPAMIRRVVIAPDVIFRPDGGGRVLAMSEALSSVPKDTVPSGDLPSITELQDRVRQLIPALEGVPFEAYRKGIRAMPTDGYPILGFDSEVNGLYYAVMHSGITLSAGVSGLIVEDLSDPDFDGLANYRPNRFAAARSVQGPVGE